jgi:hypothetical protein
MRTSQQLSLAVAFSCAAAAGLFAQANFTPQLRGTIHDAGGALVPGAHVTLTNTATNTRAENTSDSAGRYIFADLQPATYELTVAAKGFRKLLESGVELR